MSQPPQADRRVAAVIESSAVFGLLDRSLGHVWRAAAGSVVAATATQAARVWTGLATGLRRLALGIMLLTAVAAHIVFTLVTLTPPGWLWLVLPGIAGALGLLLVVASDLPRVTSR